MLGGIVAAVVLILASGSFYWFKIRPQVESSGTEASNAASSTTTGSQAGATAGAAGGQATAPKTNMNPDLGIDANGLSKATVILTTTKGVLRYKFYPKDAPNTVKRMIELINSGFYNGLTFHRVVPGFVVQGGDPEGTGMGGSGQNLKAEFNGRKHVEGSLAMARAASPDSADSQFYICLGPQPHLDNQYTVFGQLVDGFETIHRLEVGDRMTTVIIE